MDEFEPQLVVKKEGRVKPINGPGIFWLLIILTLILIAFSIMLLGQSNSDNPQVSESSSPTPVESRQARIYTVSYRGGVFSPTNLRIHSGDTVRFKNDSLMMIRVISDPHPEHNNLVGFDSVGDVPQGSYFTFTFAAKGTFGYHNEKNTDEKGTIIVR